MSRKFTFQDYEILIAFRNASSASMSVEFLPTHEFFVNTNVNFVRINRQSVMVALERKSEKNLSCEFNQVFEEGLKKLKIVFRVNFDFLPEFTEELTLDFQENKSEQSNLNYASTYIEIDELSRTLDQLNEEGATFTKSQPTFTLTQSDEKKQLFSKKMKRGTYIFKLFFSASNAVTGTYHPKITVSLSIPGQTKPLIRILKPHNMSSYYYPIEMTEFIKCDEGNLKVEGASNYANCILTNIVFVLSKAD